MTDERPISEAQLSANRKNALNSTGPRSSAGKARSKLNALRHGLAAQRHRPPGLITHLVPVAEKLAGLRASDPLVLAKALAIAEAHSDIRRTAMIRRVLHRSVLDEAEQRVGWEGGPLELYMARGVLEATRDLAALTRYERAARARLNRAIRAFPRPRAQ